MLQQICEHIHNYFIKERIEGRFTIEGGMISLPLLDGQRFLIQGSALNDGIYTYHEAGIKDDDDAEAVGLRDESFAGTISALAVPPAVIDLTGEISEWVEQNGNAIKSPYQSESVLGVYSYSKGTGGSGAGGSISWEDVFAGRLNRWRRLAF